MGSLNTTYLVYQVRFSISLCLVFAPLIWLIYSLNKQFDYWVSEHLLHRYRLTAGLVSRWLLGGH